MNASFVVPVLAGVTMATALAIVATSALRRSRAATRHAVLTAALGVALVLPIAAAIAPSMAPRVAVRAPAAVAGAVEAFDNRGPVVDVEPAPIPDGPVPVAPEVRSLSRSTIPLAIWLTGLAACLIPVAAGLVQVRRMRRTALPWSRGRVLADALAAAMGLRRRVDLVLHEAVSGPMTCGTWRPAIVMPIDADTWPDTELTQALVHELEHVRRGDWLSQSIARALCAVYWFHPLVWIARRRLVLEAERASDDAVLRYAEAPAYADQLVSLARRLSARHQPLLAMASRHDLAARVHALLDGRQSRGRAGARLVCAISLAAGALVVAVSPMRVVAESGDQQPADERPRFDVVSVKPCDPNTVAPRATGRGGNLGSSSPGRFVIECQSALSLINTAFIGYAGGRANLPGARPTMDPIQGPDWIRRDRWAIEATADPATPPSMMRGPMLQRVLEDRFKVKVHIETREIPILELIVAEGGPKLTPFEAGSCVPYDWNVVPQPPLEPSQHRCLATSLRNADGNTEATVEGLTLDSWVGSLRIQDRPVVNKTGITDRVTFRLIYSGGEGFASAIKSQLGLDLRPATGPREFLILDHIERPTPDDGFASPGRAVGSAPFSGRQEVSR